VRIFRRRSFPGDRDLPARSLLCLCATSLLYLHGAFFAAGSGTTSRIGGWPYARLDFVRCDPAYADVQNANGVLG